MRSIGILLTLALAAGVTNVAVAAGPGAGASSEQGATGAALPTEAATAFRDLYHLSKHMLAVAELGARKGGTREIRAIAKDMLEEYRKLDRELVRWSEANRIGLGEPGPAVYAEQLAALTAATGKLFDEKFLQVVSEECTKVTTAIQQVTQTAGYRDFEKLVDRAVPVLDKFVKEADKLARKG